MVTAGSRTTFSLPALLSVFWLLIGQVGFAGHHSRVIEHYRTETTVIDFANTKKSKPYSIYAACRIRDAVKEVNTCTRFTNQLSLLHNARCEEILKKYPLRSQRIARSTIIYIAKSNLSTASDDPISPLYS